MTFKVYLNERYKSKNGLYPIVIRLINGRLQKVIATGYKIKPDQWAVNSVKRHPDAVLINSKIDDLLSQIKKYISTHKVYNLQEVFKESAGNSFPGYLTHRANQYREAGKHSASVKLTRLAKEVRAAIGEITFSEITGDHLRKLNIHFKNHQNTKHKKFSTLGQLFTNAIDEGRTTPPNPFKKFKVEQVPTKKEKLTIEELEALEKAELPDKATELARDLFMFSYYSKGIRFENCVTVKRSDIQNNRIYFRTNKGKDFISVQIHSKLKTLIEKYKGPFLFPYLSEIPDDPERRRKTLDVINVIVNRNLKVAVGIAGIKKKISFHCSRHSLAFHLKQKTDNIHVISDALGHSSSRITEIYLKSLDDEFLDREMRKLYGD